MGPNVHRIHEEKILRSLENFNPVPNENKIDDGILAYLNKVMTKEKALDEVRQIHQCASRAEYEEKLSHAKNLFSKIREQYNSLADSITKKEAYLQKIPDKIEKRSRENQRLPLHVVVLLIFGTIVAISAIFAGVNNIARIVLTTPPFYNATIHSYLFGLIFAVPPVVLHFYWENIQNPNSKRKLFRFLAVNALLFMTGFLICFGWLNAIEYMDNTASIFFSNKQVSTILLEKFGFISQLFMEAFASSACTIGVSSVYSKHRKVVARIKEVKNPEYLTLRESIMKEKELQKSFCIDDNIIQDLKNQAELKVNKLLKDVTTIFNSRIIEETDDSKVKG